MAGTSRGHGGSARRLEAVRDRLLALAPWTDPEVVSEHGRPVLTVRVSHAVSLLVARDGEAWSVESRSAFDAPDTGTRRVDVGPATDEHVADLVLVECLDEWRGTLASPDAPEPMKQKAAEKLEALEALADTRAREVLDVVPAR
jgi:hypothetical protein